jgi:hypothetical protein
MRFGTILALAALGVLSGCATAQGMQHGAMSHEEMMRHCAMMEQHQAQGEGNAAHRHDPARHGGMSHEEMVRHCAMMREPQQPAESQPHQH